MDFANVLNNILSDLRTTYLPDSLISAMIKQVLFFADSQAFNFLLTQPTQTCGSGFQLKMSLSQLETSFSKTEKKLQTWVNENFVHVRQMANLLVMDKHLVMDKQAAAEIFPNLNPKQIKVQF